MVKLDAETNGKTKLEKKKAYEVEMAGEQTTNFIDFFFKLWLICQ